MLGRAAPSAAAEAVAVEILRPAPCALEIALSIASPGDAPDGRRGRGRRASKLDPLVLFLGHRLIRRILVELDLLFFLVEVLGRPLAELLRILAHFAPVAGGAQAGGPQGLTAAPHRSAGAGAATDPALIPPPGAEPGIPGVQALAERRDLAQHAAAQREAPPARELHLLRQQLGRRPVAAAGEEALAVAHLDAPRDAVALAVLVVLQHEERRVRRHDAELLAERDDLVLDLCGAALREQRVDVTAGPEPRQEGVAGLALLELELRAVAHRLAGERAGHDDGAALRLAGRQEAPEDDLLPARGQVGQALGIDARRAQARKGDREILDRGLSRLGQQTVGRCRGVVAGAAHGPAAQRRDGVENDLLIGRRSRDRVPRTLAFLRADALRQRHRVGVARRADAVAHIDDDGLLADVQLRRGERAVEVGPAQRGTLGQEVERRGGALLGHGEGLLAEPRDVDVARHEAEAVLRPEQRQEAVDKPSLRRARGRVHRGRGVRDQEQIERPLLRKQVTLPLTLRRIRRREQQHEVAVLAAAVGDDGQRAAAVDVDRQLEVALGGVLLRVELGRRRVRRVTDAHLVRRRREALQRHGGADAHVDPELTQRAAPQQLAAQRVAVPERRPLERQHLRVADADAFLGVREDREDARLEQVAAAPLQQARVLAAAQDVLVDRACALLLDDVGLDQLAADPHAEPADGCVVG